MKYALLCLLAYLLMAAGVWFGLGSLNLPRLRRLEAESVTTEGTITTPPGDHSAVSYTFKADGREVVGKGSSPDFRPSRGQVQVGDKVTVWYVPAEPTVNSLREPGRQLENERGSVGLVATVLPAFVLVFAVRGWHLRNRKAS